MHLHCSRSHNCNYCKVNPMSWWSSPTPHAKHYTPFQGFTIFAGHIPKKRSGLDFRTRSLAWNGLSNSSAIDILVRRGVHGFRSILHHTHTLQQCQFRAYLLVWFTSNNTPMLSQSAEYSGNYPNKVIHLEISLLLANARYPNYTGYM